MSVNLERVIGAEKVVTKITFRFHFRDLLVEEGGDFPELAAQVNIRSVRSNGIATNRKSFDKLEGIALHDLAVFERARFGLHPRWQLHSGASSCYQ